MHLGSFGCDVKEVRYLLVIYLPRKSIRECCCSQDWILEYLSFDILFDLSQLWRDLKDDITHPCWIGHSTKCWANHHLWVWPFLMSS